MRGRKLSTILCLLLLFGLAICVMAPGFPPQGTGIAQIDTATPTTFTGLIAGNGSLLVSGNSTYVILALGYTPVPNTNTIFGVALSNNITMSSGNVTNALGFTPVSVNATSPGQYASAKQTTTTTLSWNLGNVQYIVLANSGQTFTFANPLDGGRYALILRQPSSGAAGTVTWPTTVKWPGATAPTLSTPNNRTDVMKFIYDKTNTLYYGGASIGY